jgi:hypothetical protein
MPKEYKIKMFSVQAEQLTPQTVNEIASWVGGRPVTEYDAEDMAQRFVALNVPTMRGVERAQQGDYVIKTAEGQIGVMKAHEFEQRFEQI